jgi:dTDP-4-amino-4,6-dideoxygalactose transaminase
MQPIPQCNPKAAYLAQRQEIDAAIARTLDAGRYVLGPEVEAFEREFAAFVGTTGSLGVANGTDALELSLRALGIGPGHAVATVSHTAVATVVAIRATGATPLFVDVEAGTGLMSPESLAEALDIAHKRGGPQVKGIVPVHLYGRSANLTAILDIARSQRLVVVEDCAQSHGATSMGRTTGSWGDCASFSFYPTKNLGAIGDGGALASNDPDVLRRAKLLREYGWRERYISETEGGNSRLDELQAAILRVKLERLAWGNARRAELAARYRHQITNPQVDLPGDPAPDRHVYHQFVVRCHDRDGLRAFLANHGVGTLIHYPVPIHLQPAYLSPDYAPVQLPETERWAGQALSLPMFPELTDEDADRVARAVNEWTSGGQ